MQNYTNFLVDTAGNALSGISITVKDGGTSNVSTIYSDNGSTTTANPLTSSATGKISFWAADGLYDLYQGATLIVQSVLLDDPFVANTTDTANVVRDISATITLKVPTSAPGSPAAGHVWEASGILKHGASSRSLVDLEGSQTISGDKTFSAPIISTVATGTAPFTVASTTVVTNLKADLGGSATSFFDSGNLELARLPVGSANQVLGTNSGATAQEHKTLSVGASGADFAIAHSANAIAFNLPDAGAGARGAVTTGTQTFAGNKTTSGTLTPTGGIVCTGRSAYSTVTIGASAYSALGAEINPVAGTIYYAEVFLPRNMTITGIGVINGVTVGTNKYIFGLHTSAGGATVANTDLAGTLTVGSRLAQLVPFTAPYAAVGPARYWIAMQLDGNTDTVKVIAANTFIDTFTTSVTGSFGTLPSLTPPTSFATNKGPIAWIYA